MQGPWRQPAVYRCRSRAWSRIPDRQFPIRLPGCGGNFASRIRQRAGTIPQGDVFRTGDQIVTVEASNTFEAMVVLRDNTLVGFYLPVEHSFVAATEPVKLPIQQGAQP